MSAKLIYFNFIGANGVNDSPCAINASQIVYMYTTQTNKTAVVFTNGNLRVSSDTIKSFKSGRFSQGLGEFVSIGIPTKTGSSAWPSDNGEVLVNSSYISQLTASDNLALVVMNQPASAPVSFTTAKSQSSIIVESRSNDSPFSFINLEITQSGATDPVINKVYSNVGLSLLDVTGTRSNTGTYDIAFPTGVVLNNASVFASAPTGSPIPIIKATAAESASSIQIVTQGTGFTNADGILTNTKINVLSWPTEGLIDVGSLAFGGIVFKVDYSTRTAYVVADVDPMTATYTFSASNLTVTGINASTTSNASFSAANTAAIIAAGVDNSIATPAATWADGLTQSGFSDWVLPTRDALLEIANNVWQPNIGTFINTTSIPTTTYFWSSNDNSASTSGTRVQFLVGGISAATNTFKTNPFRALAIRTHQY